MHPHLATRVAELRYSMAANWLVGIDHIYEIGGARTPIDTFLSPGQYRSCTTIDPTIETNKFIHHHCNGCGAGGSIVNHHQMLFQDFEWPGRVKSTGRRGLVMMGIELVDCEVEDLMMLEPVIRGMSICVFEHVVTNPTAAEQVGLFEEFAMTTMRKAVEVTGKFEYDAGYRRPNESFHKTRRFVVYLDDDLYEVSFSK